MTVSLDFSNQYLSANNSEESDLLKFYDSDGNFIDYISLDNYGPPFDGTLDVLGRLFLTCDFYGLNDADMADILLGYLEAVDDVVYAPDFEELYKTYGKEYINRIGTCALIIKE